MMSINKKRNEKGFTLIELAIVLMIGGLVLAAGARGMKSKVLQEKYDAQEETMDTVLTAFANFTKDDRLFEDQIENPAGSGNWEIYNSALPAHQALVAADPAAVVNQPWNIPPVPSTAPDLIDERYDEVHWPCPANPKLSVTDGDFGVEERVIPLGKDPKKDANLNCDITNLKVVGAQHNRIFIGAVPTATLGLPASKALDIYGNKLTYAISESYAKSLSLQNAAATLNPEILIRKYQADGTLGASQQAEFALFSHGPDGSGAYPMNPGATPAPNPCVTTAKDGANCDFLVGSATEEEKRTFIDSSLAYSEAKGDDRLDDTMAFSVAAFDADEDGFWTLASTPGIRPKDVSWNVGIGTESPTEQLHVAGDTLLDGDSAVTGNSAVSGNATIGGTAAIAGNTTIGTAGANSIMTVHGNALVSSRLGIGTTSPVARLDVAGSPDATNAYFDGGLRIDSHAGFVPDILMDTNGFIMAEGNVQVRAGDAILLEAGSNDDILFRSMGTTTTELMRITSAGNLGIGTNSPVARLDVAGSFDATNAYFDGGLRIDSNAGSQPDVYMGGGGSIAADSALEFRARTGASDLANTTAFSFKRGSLTGTGIDLMTLRNDGKVGIGTTAPTSLLDVAGEIRTGNSGLACNASSNTAGAIRRVEAAGGLTRMQYCSGASGWVDFQSSRVCPSGTAVTEISPTGAVTCGPLPWPATPCGPGDVVVEIASDGSATCRDLDTIVADCGTGTVMTGLNSNGSPRCMDISHACGSGQYMIGVKTDGTPNCANLSVASCGAGQVMVGINSNGTPNCMDISHSCPAGQVMSGVKTDGTPNCVDNQVVDSEGLTDCIEIKASEGRGPYEMGTLRDVAYLKVDRNTTVKAFIAGDGNAHEEQCVNGIRNLNPAPNYHIYNTEGNDSVYHWMVYTSGSFPTNAQITGVSACGWGGTPFSTNPPQAVGKLLPKGLGKSIDIYTAYGQKQRLSLKRVRCSAAYDEEVPFQNVPLPVPSSPTPCTPGLTCGGDPNDR